MTVSAEVLEKLKLISLFRPVADKPDILNQIAAEMEKRQFRKGDRIIEEGQDGSEMFILMKGEIEICKYTMERETFTVAKLKDSMNVFFGELALVDDDKRSASVVAMTDGELLVLSRTRFLELGKRHTELGWLIMREIAGILSKRLRKANDDTVVLFETLVNELVT